MWYRLSQQKHHTQMTHTNTISHSPAHPLKELSAVLLDVGGKGSQAMFRVSIWYCIPLIFLYQKTMN